MECPEGWSIHDHNWWSKQVEITPDRWLLMFFCHSDHPSLPVAWVNLCKGEWAKAKGEPKDFYLRELQVQRPSSMMEVRCIELEWTEEVLRTLETQVDG
jgi:hypothetical protein